MSKALKRTLWIAGCLLALLLCVLFFPLGNPLKAISTLLIALVAGIGWWRIGHAARALHHAPLGDSLTAALPAAGYRQPIVLTVGDQAATLFDGELVRETPQGCYILIPRVDQLAHYAEMLLALRPEWTTQLSVLFVLLPQQHDDRPVLAAQLREFRFQAQRCARLSDCAVPALLACYLHGEPGPWFTLQADDKQTRVWDNAQRASTLSEWLRSGNCRQQEQQLASVIALGSVSDWLQQQVINEFHTGEQPGVPLHLLATSVRWLPTPTPRADNLWQQWLMAKTTLLAGEQRSQQDAGVQLPDCLLPLLPTRSGYSPQLRAAGYGIVMLMLFSVVAMASSSMNNRQLMWEIHSDIERYQAIPMTSEQPKVEALNQLKTDAQRLEKYHRNGTPLRLGLGLYPGERIYPPLMAAIRSYVPPAPLPEKPAPKLVRLDSMSLFEVGKAQLKAGSTKLMVDALIDIKAKPGRMVLITGHTDVTGNAHANQQLSLERAAAVRDWMIATSDIPETCFAIQGYGATRPVATNSTTAGRAANRRVEISLVPDAAACQPAARHTDRSFSSPAGDFTQ